MNSKTEKASNDLHDEAETHATHCASLLSTNLLAEAINYCNLQGIESPQCSLTAQSPNAHKLREKAKDMLSDVNWWSKRLKIKDLRDFEHRQIYLKKLIIEQ